MGGEVNTAQIACSEHGGIYFRLGGCCHIFEVTQPCIARQHRCFFVDRGVDHRCDFMVQGQLHRHFQVGHRGFAALRGDLTGLDIIPLREAHIQNVDFAKFTLGIGSLFHRMHREIIFNESNCGFQGVAFPDHQRTAHFINRLIRQRFNHNFRSDTGRVADGDCDNRSLINGHYIPPPCTSAVPAALPSINPLKLITIIASPVWKEAINFQCYI